MTRLWKHFFFFSISLWACLIALPTFLPKNILESYPRWLPTKQMTLGLDLKGGVHMVLEVDVQQAYEESIAQLTKFIRTTCLKEAMHYSGLHASKDSVMFVLKNPEHAKKLQERITQTYGVDVFQLHSEKNRLSLSLTEGEKLRMLRETMSKSVEIIRKRIDESGTLEPLIQTQGRNHIVLEIPGFEDPKKVRSLLGKTAKLSFQLVSNKGIGKQLPFEDLPGQTLPVLSDVLLTGETLLNAKASYGSEPGRDAQPRVTLVFSKKGSDDFARITQEHIGERLAIILDGHILSAPLIQEPIHNGQASISGSKTIEDAGKLALMMRSGSLPAPLHILEEKVLGPSLGHDSIVSGSTGTIVAIVVVSLWMLLNYSFFGGFSVLGILLNVIFLLAALVSIEATLTLPGLAGIALTVGMSVDTNVLINERIKEELAAGKSAKEAVAYGYDRAKTSVLDSNITTLNGSFLMYVFGTGPVKGFAITMALGILVSLFTSMILIQSLVRYWMKRYGPKHILI